MSQFNIKKKNYIKLAMTSCYFGLTEHLLSSINLQFYNFDLRDTFYSTCQEKKLCNSSENISDLVWKVQPYTCRPPNQLWNAALIRPSCFQLCEPARLNAKQAGRCYVLRFLQVPRQPTVLRQIGFLLQADILGCLRLAKGPGEMRQERTARWVCLISASTPLQPSFPAAAPNCVSRWSCSGPLGGRGHIYLMWIRPHTTSKFILSHTNPI